MPLRAFFVWSPGALAAGAPIVALSQCPCGHFLFGHCRKHNAFLSVSNGSQCPCGHFLFGHTAGAGSLALGAPIIACLNALAGIFCLVTMGDD